MGFTYEQTPLCPRQQLQHIPGRGQDMRQRERDGVEQGNASVRLCKPRRRYSRPTDVPCRVKGRPTHPNVNSHLSLFEKQ